MHTASFRAHLLSCVEIPLHTLSAYGFSRNRRLAWNRPFYCCSLWSANAHWYNCHGLSQSVATLLNQQKSGESLKVSCLVSTACWSYIMFFMKNIMTWKSYENMKKSSVMFNTWSHSAYTVQAKPEATSMLTLMLCQKLENSRNFKDIYCCCFLILCMNVGEHCWEFLCHCAVRICR